MLQSERALPAQHAAGLLWILAYWSDERMSAFQRITGRSPIHRYGQAMEYWPTPAVPAAYVERVTDMLTRIETSWGRSLDAVATEMGGDVEELAYRAAMACIGHGIGPEDVGTFPDDLDASPYHTEDPAYYYLPDDDDFDGIDAEELSRRD